VVPLPLLLPLLLAVTGRDAATRSAATRSAAIRSAVTRDAIARAAAIAAARILRPLPAQAVAHPHPPHPLEGMWRRALATAPQVRAHPLTAIVPQALHPIAAAPAARMTSAEGSTTAAGANPAAIKAYHLATNVSNFD